MKKIILAIFMLVTAAIFCGGNGALAITPDPYDDYDPYKFEVSGYDITFDVAANSSIKVTEDITIKYQGYESTGFIRDIPVNGGVQVRNVEVKKIDNSGLTEVWYDVYHEGADFLSVDIGDSSNKFGKSERYLLTYDYNITNGVVNDGMLSVNPVGFGWNTPLYDVTVKTILPDGFISSACYVGPKGTSLTYNGYEMKTENGKKVITAAFDGLDGAGVTFDLTFEKGAIKSYTDFSPYYYVLGAVAVLAVMILLKVFVFNKNKLMPVVNYSAPNDMDPLLMGKLIDNRVNEEDITSLIYYWAGKGYIKINLDDKNDPALIRVMRELPEPCTPHERVIYNGLFRNRDLVRPSMLKNNFYKVAESATSIVNRNTKGLYDTVSIGVSVLFAVLGGLILGLVPALIGFTAISHKLLSFVPFISLVPALVIYAFAEGLVFNRHKYGKGKFYLMAAGLVLACAVFCAAYVFFLPENIMGVGAKIVLFIVSSLIFAFSVSLINRTKDYTDKLNEIIGFKQFIQLAEKDQLEAMLEEDPQFYYHILPYAQVLGVTDIWENKFEGITVAPPDWLAGDMLTTYFEFRVINSVMRSSMQSMRAGMVSRPSSSGANGGGRFGGGGGHGGFSGGGFGGGGGRGR